MILRRICSVFFLCCLISLYCQGQGTIEDQIKHEINKLIRYEAPINYDEIPGFIVTLIDHDSTYHVSFGSHVGQESQIKPTDLFEVGSLSKALMPEILMHGDSMQDLKIEDLVIDHLDIAGQADIFEGLSIRSLLKHQTNLTKRPRGFGLKESDLKNPYLDYTPNDFKRYLLNIKKPIIADACSYSHSNYAMIEMLDGINLDQAAQLFFDDLGMNNSSFYDTDDLIAGLDKSGQLAKPWNFNLFRYSEGLKTTANDLQLFVRHLLELDTDRWDVYTSEKCSTIYNKHYYNTLGWSIIENEAKFDIFALTGRTRQHSSFVAFIKETETAVIILSNSSIGTKDLGMAVLRTLNNNWKRKS